MLQVLARPNAFRPLAAADILGLTPRQTAWLAATGDLTYHDDGHRLLVSLRSVLDRKAAQ